MKCLRLVALATLCAALSACGGGGSSNGSSQSTTSAPVTGNWQISVNSTAFPGTPGVLVGNLTSSGTAVSGVFHISGSSCYDFSTDVPMSGSINGSAVTLTSAPVSSQVISTTLTASPDGSSISGKYSIAGGCATGDQGTVSGVRVPSFSGTWTGTFTSSSGQAISASATLTQGTAGADGLIPITGSVQFTNSSCFSSGNLTSTVAIGGFMAGSITTAEGGGAQGNLDVNGQLNDPATGRTLALDYQDTVGVCAGDSGSGTLTKQ